MPSLESTPVPGLLVVRLDVHEDSRGWFKESWQRDKLVGLGFPDFGPVQHNVSFNARRGVTRGIHAEPWDKFVTVAAGRVFGAWVDLREGPSFGATYSCEIGPDTGVYVPRGVGNAFQVLEDATAYSYLVNDHWRPGAGYVELNLADETAGIAWPVPLDDSSVEMSAKDRDNPRLADVHPIPRAPVLVIGGSGQVGTALRAVWPDAVCPSSAELDLADPHAVRAFDFTPYDVVVNAAAFTAVDAAETETGRARAWALNATAPALLAQASVRDRFTLVHYSTDYVYDGTLDPHVEDEPVAPLGVYGQSKAAGDLAVAAAPRSYVLRTSWVIGSPGHGGGNFVRTMQRLANEGVSPRVVADQVGRLTFADDLAAATRHLLVSAAPYGTYHVSNAGAPASWAEIAREVFSLCGRDPADVTETTTAAYAEAQLAAGRPWAPRPLRSTLDLGRLSASGFTPRDQRQALAAYLRAEPAHA